MSVFVMSDTTNNFAIYYRIASEISTQDLGQLYVREWYLGMTNQSPIVTILTKIWNELQHLTTNIM